jgi:hypothetical protein
MGQTVQVLLRSALHLAAVAAAATAEIQTMGFLVALVVEVAAMMGQAVLGLQGKAIMVVLASVAETFPLVAVAAQVLLDKMQLLLKRVMVVMVHSG